MSVVQRLLWLVPVALVAACASSLRPGEHAPVEFSEAVHPQAEDGFPNWPVPPDRAETLLTSGNFEVREVKGAGGGTTGAEKHTLYFPDPDIEFKVKWKVVPGDLDGINNSPRKELAAYAIQTILFEPQNYVVPTSVVLCVPIDQYRERHPMATPTVSGTKCVMGVLSVWLQDVTVPEELYDPERFVSDAQYAHYLSNLNLFTYLVDHRDGRDGNFLVSTDDSRRQAFAVDNGISFGPMVFNYFVPNWTHLRVAAVRTETIERLRKLQRKDLDFLLVVVQLEADESGMLVNVPPGPPINPAGGANERDGVVQFGLKTKEIDSVFSRIQKLIQAVDAGEVPGF